MYNRNDFQRMKTLAFILISVLLCYIFIFHILSADASREKLLSNENEERCTYVYLPNVVQYPINYLEGSIEQEPNDTVAEANGIYLNKEYIGFPGPTDYYDRYVFNLIETTTITTEVTNHDADAGQLILRDANLVLIDYVYNPPHHLMVFSEFAPWSLLLVCFNKYYVTP